MYSGMMKELKVRSNRSQNTLRETQSDAAWFPSIDMLNTSSPDVWFPATRNSSLSSLIIGNASGEFIRTL